MKGDFKVFAVVLAGGKGVRLNSSIPKQFIEVRGKKLLEYTLEKFQMSPSVDEIILVVPRDFIGLGESFRKQFCKISKVVGGGSTRVESSRNGVFEIDESKSIVLIHDGARPNVNVDTIERIVDVSFRYGACIPVLPSIYTLVSVNESSVEGYLEREKIFQVQTPQGFRFEIISAAHEKALKDGKNDFTDDGSMVIYYSISKVYYVIDDDTNIKITTMKDLKVFEMLLGKNF